MSFERESFDFVADQEEREIRERKLESLLKQIGEQLNQEGVLVDEDCRIQMAAFGNIHGVEAVQEDRKLVESHQQDWYPEGISEKELKERKMQNRGERLEMLKTVVFSKFLGKKFVVVRSAPYDDIVNKIDNVIIEKETGNIVCAFDEVSEVSGPRYETKKKKILERNRKEQGGRLKYGLHVEKNTSNQPVVTLAEVDHIPIFYLALPEDTIEESIQHLVPSLESVSEYERKLFSYFIAALSTEIQFLGISKKNLNPQLAERINVFKETLRTAKFFDTPKGA